jgi:hypothetical protein
MERLRVVVTACWEPFCVAKWHSQDVSRDVSFVWGAAAAAALIAVGMGGAVGVSEFVNPNGGC